MKYSIINNRDTDLCKLRVGDLKLGVILLVGLVLEIVLTVIGMFFFSDLVMAIIACFGVLIFSTYILFDLQALKSNIDSDLIMDKDDLSIFVLNIYVDIINIFIRLLRILSYFSNNSD